MSTCPSPEILVRLGHDSLHGTEWIAVEAHLQACNQCVGLLERLAAHDTASTTATVSASVLLPEEESLPLIPGFEIEAEIGRGGMGVVYRAWEPKLAHTVALKIVPSGPMTGARERKRWLSEARCVTRVCHPNIVQIHDAGEADGWLYLVLEFVPGGSLKERLRGPVPPRAAAELMRPVAAAMNAVHRAGLLHLDLKPSNILLDSALEAAWSDASPKVADFGIARHLTDLDATSTSLAGPWGTPSYMAPEQVAADRAALGPATDVYALGVILYELLTGRPPFLAASTIETFDQIRNAEPASPRRLNPSVPRDLDTITLRCLHKDLRKRYPTTEALTDDLNRFLEGRPIEARPVSPFEHAWRWCRRQPVIAALAATLFLTVIGSFLVLLALLRRSEANHQVASRSLAELSAAVLDEGEDSAGFFSTSHFKTLELARSLENDLAKQYPPDSSGLKRLAMIDTYLANFYARNGNYDHARSLKEESIRYSQDYLAQRPDDLAIQQLMVDSARGILAYVSGSKGDRLYELWDTQAIALLERLKSPSDGHLLETFLLSYQHRAHANASMLSGESARARKELERDLHLLRSSRGAETASREFVLSEALTLAALGRWSGEITPLEPSVRSRPAIIDVKFLESCVAELTARRIGWLPSIERSSWLLPEGLLTEAWTDLVISSIKSDASKFDLDHTRIPAIGWKMSPFCYNMMAQQRAAGKLGDAHRLADQFLALAEALTRSYPDQAAAYMLLSDGYVQKAKNAYLEEEAPAIQRWEQKALDAAMHAATLEPENDEARNLVENRRARLVKLASGM